MSFATASTTLRSGAVVGGLALLLHLIGFATPGWSTGRGGGLGLWQICELGQCVTVPGGNSKFDGTRAMETIGFILLVVTVGGSFLVTFAEQYRTRNAQIAVATSALIAAIAIEIGIIIYGTSVPLLGYSFYLSLFGGILAFAAGVLLFRPMGNE